MKVSHSEKSSSDVYPSKIEKRYLNLCIKEFNLFLSFPFSKVFRFAMFCLLSGLIKEWTVFQHSTITKYHLGKSRSGKLISLSQLFKIEIKETNWVTQALTMFQREGDRKEKKDRKSDHLIHSEVQECFRVTILYSLIFISIINEQFSSTVKTFFLCSSSLCFHSF